MRLTRTNISILLAAALVIGAAITAVVMINAPSAAQAAATALEESSEEVASTLSDHLSPERPLVIVTDIFRRGGYKTADAADWTMMEIYGEQVTQKIVITPNASGMAVGFTDDVANSDGSPHIVENLMDGTRTVAPVGNTGTDDGGGPADGGLLGDTDGEPGPTGNIGIDEPWEVATWLDAKLALPQTITGKGYEYVGRFELDGQPSVRYEYRETLGVLPNGQVFDPPIVSVSVMEFVEANPLLLQESHYVEQHDGTSTLEYQRTVTSVSAGEPTTPAATPTPEPSVP